MDTKGKQDMTETGNENQAVEQDANAGTPKYSPEELAAGSGNDDVAKADINLDLVLDIPVDISLRVGSTDISIRDLVSLVEGSVIALDREADQSMEVLVNGTLIAHGEIVVVDNRFGVRLTDVISPAERIEKLN